MNTRITSSFASARVEKRKLLCPFLTAGYPSLDATVQLLQATQRAGGAAIGAVELGIPFSDPVADGPVIQASFTHALSPQGGNVTMARTLAMVQQARQAGVTLPLLAMVSFSIIFRKGTREFARDAAAAGIDGVVLPDIPLEEAPAVADAFHQAGLATSFLVAPTTAPVRRAAIARLCDAFVYYLSVSGITGERKELPPDIAQNVAALRQVTSTPICVGFGIATAEHVRQVVAVADGAIVGSAIIRRIAEHLHDPAEKLNGQVESLIRELVTGLG